MLLGARTAAWAKSGVQNLWVWPTEYAPNYGDRAEPTSVINPHIGMWQGSAASNGYIRNLTRGSFTGSSVSTAFDSGYSMAVFLDLPSGDYRMTCKCDALSGFTTSTYNHVEGGYINSGSKQHKFQEGSVLIEFTVPDDSLVLFRPSPRYAEVVMTTTDIVLVKNQIATRSGAKQVAKDAIHDNGGGSKDDARAYGRAVRCIAGVVPA